MATNPFPSGIVSQNPAPAPVVKGQEAITSKAELVQAILDRFRQVLPSNYVATTTGPWYSLQFQAIAEQLADIQLQSTEVALDSFWDFTRSDFLWSQLGALVFPKGVTEGIPVINGDITYRDFLKAMVLALLQGATKESLESGIAALDPDLVVYITERYLESRPRNPTGLYDIKDQFILDILVDAGNTFPQGNPATLTKNIDLIVKALKPAHVLYTSAVLFTEEYTTFLAEETTWVIDEYHYDDLRVYNLGAKEITGLDGEILARRDLFSDPTRSFASVRAGAIAIIDGNRYRVQAIWYLLSGTDTTPRPYTTSGGLSGMVVAQNDRDLYDAAQDWGAALLNETVTILSGPNAGTYRLETVLGLHGGPVGGASLTGTSVRIAPSILRLDRRAAAAATGLSYTVTVNRLGRQEVQVVTGEDVEGQFYL